MKQVFDKNSQQNNGQKKMSNLINKNLQELYTSKKANGATIDTFRMRGWLRSRMNKATDLRNSELSKFRPSKSLTDYANELLSNDFKKLVTLLYDYTGSNMYLTTIKHQLLMRIRQNHNSNVREMIREMLVNHIESFIKNGRLRNSDRIILKIK